MCELVDVIQHKSGLVYTEIAQDTCHCAHMRQLSRSLQCTIRVWWPLTGDCEVYRGVPETGGSTGNTPAYSIIALRHQGTERRYYLLTVNTSEDAYLYDFGKLPGGDGSLDSLHTSVQVAHASTDGAYACSITTADIVLQDQTGSMAGQFIVLRDTTMDRKPHT